MSPRAERLLRGSLLGAVATTLAALSHGWADGYGPSALSLVLGVVFASAVGTLAFGRRHDGRRLPLPRIVVAVGLGQLAFHTGFSLLGTGATVTTHGGHHATIVLSGAGAHVAHEGTGMWAAHTVAGILTVTYLTHLERRVWGLLTQLARFVLRPVAVVPRRVVGGRRLIASVRPPARPVPALRGGVARRGPPLLLGA